MHGRSHTLSVDFRYGNSRRDCPGCKEELAMTAYYRHQTGNCPTNHHERLPNSTPTSSGESCFDEQESDGVDLHSSFCFSDTESVISPDDNTQQTLLGTTDDEAEIDDMLGRKVAAKMNIPWRMEKSGMIIPMHQMRK